MIGYSQRVSQYVESWSRAAILNATEAVPATVVEWRIVGVATWHGARLAIDVESEIR